MGTADFCGGLLGTGIAFRNFGMRICRGPWNSIHATKPWIAKGATTHTGKHQCSIAIRGFMACMSGKQDLSLQCLFLGNNEWKPPVSAPVETFHCLLYW